MTSTGSLFNHFSFESNLVHLINNLRLGHLVRIIKDISSFSLEANACFLHPFEPFQGFLNDQWSYCSGHALDIEDDLICESVANRGNHRHC